VAHSFDGDEDSEEEIKVEKKEKNKVSIKDKKGKLQSGEIAKIENLDHLMDGLKEEM
jgi:hypothetical protein